MQGQGFVMCNVSEVAEMGFALQGTTPLHHAAMSGSVQQAQALLTHGADIHAQATMNLCRKVSPGLFMSDNLARAC